MNEHPAPHAALQQYDLKSPVARGFVAEARIQPGQAVLEVGPGLGRITDHLLQAGARVLAIERDASRAAHLRTRYHDAIQTGAVQILTGDALDLVPALPAEWRVVANPPFQLTSRLLRQWLLEDLPAGPPARIDLVLQRQAAQRLCGSANYGHSRPGVLCHLFGSPRLLRFLKRWDTRPRAHVDLVTFSLKRAGSAALPAADLRLVDRLLAAAFAGPHSLREALQGLATKGILATVGARHGFRPDAHPRSLPPPAWLDLARYLHQIGRL